VLASFCEIMGPFFGGGGMPPVVAPEGDLGFSRKAMLPFNFVNSLRFTSVQPTGVLGT
jgi:hypothetical protein